MHTILSLFVLSAFLLNANAANADDVGAIGPLVALQINTTSGDAYLQYHGRMFVDSGSGLDEYRWGGTSCGSRNLTEEQTATLQRALNNKQMRIRPISQDGQGGTICVVGFSLMPKKSIKLGIP